MATMPVDLVARDDPIKLQTQRVTRPTFLALMWLFTSLSCIFLIVRLLIRLKIFRRLGLDDFLVILAWCSLLASAIIWQVKLYVLYWLNDIATGKTPPTLDFVAAYASFSPQIVTWTILYYVCLWSVKYSFLVFFRQLDAQALVNGVWWWVVLTITSAGLIASIADIPYNCSVRDTTYVFSHCGTSASIKYDTDTLYGNMAIDVLTDILILSIPIKLLWHVQISTKQKLILGGVFSATIVIMAISIIRAILVKPDVTASNEPDSADWLYLWSMIEMGVAIMIANVASFRQLFIGTAIQPAPSSRASSISGTGLLSYLRHPLQSFTKRSTSRILSSEDGMGEKLEDLSPASQPSESNGHTSAGSIYVHNRVDIVHDPLPTHLQPSQMHQKSWDPVGRQV